MQGAFVLAIILLLVILLAMYEGFIPKSHIVTDAKSRPKPYWGRRPAPLYFQPETGIVRSAADMGNPETVVSLYPRRDPCEKADYQQKYGGPLGYNESFYY